MAPSKLTPPPAAIAELKADPSLAAEFERKYGDGSSKAPLREVTATLQSARQISAVAALVEALVGHLNGPKRFTRDADGNITGFEHANPQARGDLRDLLDRVLGSPQPKQAALSKPDTSEEDMAELMPVSSEDQYQSPAKTDAERKTLGGHVDQLEQQLRNPPPPPAAPPPVPEPMPPAPIADPGETDVAQLGAPSPPPTGIPTIETPAPEAAAPEGMPGPPVASNIEGLPSPSQAPSMPPIPKRRPRMPHATTEAAPERTTDQN